MGHAYLVFEMGDSRVALATDSVVTVGVAMGDVYDLSERQLGPSLTTRELSPTTRGLDRDITILCDTTTLQVRVTSSILVRECAPSDCHPLPEAFFGRTPFRALLALGKEGFALVLDPSSLARFARPRPHESPHFPKEHI